MLLNEISWLINYDKFSRSYDDLYTVQASLFGTQGTYIFADNVWRIAQSGIYVLQKSGHVDMLPSPKISRQDDEMWALGSVY